MDLETLHTKLVAELDTSEAVRAAFTDHPRHRFIPDVVWPDVQGLPLIRTQAPERWAAYVYDDGAVITQANDGGSGLTNAASSSSSAPQLMADMIAAAGVEPGMRVLEIGTGTGWNAAILSSLVGPTGHVTSVEIDADVAARAGSRLAGTGVRVVNSSEPPSGESYDVLIATCAVRRVPVAWLDCVDHGAVLVVPWAAYAHGGPTPVTALRKTGEADAEGPMVRDASFMRDRTQREPGQSFPGVGQDPEGEATFPIGSDELITRDLLTRLALACPGVHTAVGGRPWKDGRARIVAVGDARGWAWIWPDGGVTSGGRPSALEAFTAAFTNLEGAGWPELSAFSLSASARSGVCTVRSSSGSWEHRA